MSVRTRIFKDASSPGTVSQLGDNILAVAGTSCTLYKAQTEAFVGPTSIGIRMECKDASTGTMTIYEKTVDGPNNDLANFTEIGTQ